jgi:hypothetical protein
MGEVYRATDTKLNRDVAIKVLPEAFALDADRLARFTREAQTLAALNHPNIAQIYGIEQDGSGLPPGETRPPSRALVMEFVEGEDLSVPSRAARSRSPALPIARQIIDALEAAHEQASSIATSSPRTSRSGRGVLTSGWPKRRSGRRGVWRRRDEFADHDRWCDADGDDHRHGGLHGTGAGAAAIKQARGHMGLRRRA